MYLLWGFLILPVLFIIFEYVHKLIAKSNVYMSDNFSGILMAVPILIFVVIASKRFYGYRYWQSILFALYFLIAHTIIVHYIYKFILFVTVINQIK